MGEGQVVLKEIHRLFVYLIVIAMVLVMSWEHNQEVAASLLEQEIIPEEALRLRVLAHSDHPQDQWLKREVRDTVIEQVLTWVEDVENVEEAESEIVAQLNELEDLVQETIAKHGFSYSFTLEYGSIPFPAKLYGNHFYPAGEYTGLLITIGEGQGDNWWCVLFPPLCFVDFGTGEVIDPDQTFGSVEQEGNEETAEKDGSVIEIRFFLLDLFLKIKSLFVK